LNSQNTCPTLAGTFSVRLNRWAFQKFLRQIKMTEGADQALVRGTGTQAEAPAVTTAHDLDHGQARHILVGRGPSHQSKPTPALVLSQEIDQHHHDHPGQGIVKWFNGVHDGMSSKWGGGW
jgi:hypothetical protein